MSIKSYSKQSTVTSYGQGLFAITDIKKGTLIDEFKGKYRKTGTPTNSRSTVIFADDTFIECNANNLASFANDGINYPTERRPLLSTLKSSEPFYSKHPGTTINAHIKLNNNLHRAFLIADMDIPKDTEIFCHYGFPYWFRQELARGFPQEDEIEQNGFPDDIFTYPSFSSYITEFYPTSTKFEVKPYGDYFDVIITMDDGDIALVPVDNYFKLMKKVRV